MNIVPQENKVAYGFHDAAVTWSQGQGKVTWDEGHPWHIVRSDMVSSLESCSFCQRENTLRDEYKSIDGGGHARSPEGLCTQHYCQ